MFKHYKQSGFIAMVSLLIITTAGLTIGLAISIASIEELGISLNISESAKARALANTCVEEGLERLRNSFVDYFATLSIGSNSCIINAVVVGSNATLTATGTVGVYTQKIIVVATNALEITSWVEE